MIITIEQTAQILNLSNDEVLFYHQSGKLPATVNQENLAWQFTFDDVIKLKEEIEEDKKADNKDPE